MVNQDILLPRYMRVFTLELDPLPCTKSKFIFGISRLLVTDSGSVSAKANETVAPTRPFSSINQLGRTRMFESVVVLAKYLV